jgi:hypothetical protein
MERLFASLPPRLDAALESLLRGVYVALRAANETSLPVLGKVRSAREGR